MKKITLSVALLLGALTMNAQVLSADSSAKQSINTSSISTFGTNAVVVEQLPDDAGNGYPSWAVATADGQIPIYMATYFSTDEEVSIGTIKTYGFNNNQNIAEDLLGVNVLITPNTDNDLPSAPSETNTDAILFMQGATGANEFELGAEEQSITIDVQNYNDGEPVTLPAGDYWIAVSPILDAGADVNSYINDNGNLWYAFTSAGTTGAPSVAVWDPVNLFDAGADADFISATILSETLDGQLAFTIDDVGGVLAVTNLDTNEFMYSNTNERLALSANTTINNVVIYNMLGQKVLNNELNTNKGEVSISSLQSGVYIAKVQIEGQSQTFKFVKK